MTTMAAHFAEHLILKPMKIKHLCKRLEGLDEEQAGGEDGDHDQ